MDRNDGVERELKGHGWLGRAADGGSNEKCAVSGCGQLRLGKLHIGYAPKFFDDIVVPQGSVEIIPTEKELYIMELVRRGVYAVVPVEEATRPQQSAWGMSPAERAWAAYSEQVAALLKEKNAYGTAWQDAGYMSNLSRILSKASRLKNMMWRDDESNGIGASVGGESVADTLLDLGPLAAFMVTNFEEGNRWGS